jgi:hypothetical protein
MEPTNTDHIRKLKPNLPCPSTKTIEERFIIHLLPAKVAPFLNTQAKSRKSWDIK